MKLLPEETAKKYGVVPLEIRDGYLWIAAPQDNPQVANLLSMVTQRRVKFVVTNPAEIARVQEAVYGRVVTVSQSSQSQIDAGTWAVQALERIVGTAVQARASDIHFEPQDNKAIIRYRIDGVLHDAGDVTLVEYQALLGRIKVIAGMSVVDHLLPQDGQIRFQGVDVRASTLPTVCGEKVVLRLLDRSRVIVDLERLGFEESALRAYREAVQKPYGMVLIAGPTGSGKTTTLYATIAETDKVARNVVTLEDPVEFRFERVSQVQVNPKAGLTFASGLRSILRQDPDVIVVGEIRDRETADIAIQAALTGHLVLSSVHATDTVSAVFRLLDIGVEPYLVAAALNGIAAQRLVRKVCKSCAREVSVSEVELAYAKTVGIEVSSQCAGVGCPDCAGTGFKGRSVAGEVL
ncbi:MAG: GspE/PulE family protein, partial [Anaerolineae bacterium]